jgi:hypothetical protein
MNRLTRDQLIHRALNLIDSSALDQKDRPLGTALSPQAITIGFLQDGLDFFHRKFPWTGLVARQSFTIASGVAEYPLATLVPDYVLDVRDGVRIVGSAPQNFTRLQRKSLTYILDRPTDAPGTPAVYCLVSGVLRLWPVPDKTWTGGELWYYKLPPILAAGDIPAFPDDWTLVEFIRLRGKEWTGEAPPGAAMDYCNLKCAELQRAGLGNEAVEDSLGLDRTFYRPFGAQGEAGRGSWMGSTVVTP